MEFIPRRDGNEAKIYRKRRETPSRKWRGEGQPPRRLGHWALVISSP
ncbi:hypothetical protein LC653_14830 [Nostoc sp. CHAB 5784]|nr:hypothetical protein [Nostoc mirabile CHAB5784]